jgi:hypothetical protein
MKQPEGYVRKGEESLVCKLKKSLYGLKQAPRQWNKKFTEFLTEKLGFFKCQKEFSTYVRGSGKNQIYIGIYVDDLIIIGEDLKEIQKVKEKLSQRFDMQDFGELKGMLGIKVDYDREKGTLSLSQGKYVEEILKRFRMESVSGVISPLQSGIKYSRLMEPKTEKEKDEMSKVPYRSAVGSLMYLMLCTRPDIAASIGVMSRFLNNPGKQHWEGVKRIIRYVKATKDLKLTFERKIKFDLKGFVDADYAGCIDTSRSTTGWIFLLGGCAISWCSKRQTAVTLSTCEAEYMACGSAVKEALFLREYLMELGIIESEKAMKIYSDSQSAIHLMKNPVLHQSTKHIRVSAHFIRECYQKGLVKVQFVPTKQQLADFLTKAMTREKMELCRSGVGLY